MSKFQQIKSETVPQVRAVCLAPYIEVAGKLGLDPYEMLRKAKIRPEELADPETPLAASAVVRLGEDTARLAGCETFGLMMTETRNFASLGPITLLLQHRNTVRETIESLVKYQRMQNDIIDHVLEDDGEVATVRIDVLPGYGARQCVEFSVAMTVRALRELSDGRWRPEAIHFRHAAPADIGAHKRFFQCRVEFDSDFDGFSCASASLEVANPAANEIMARHAEHYLEMLGGARATASVTDQVRRTINSMLNRSTVTMDSVADHLGLHPRMLQRLLEKEGATFAALLNEIRRELAVRYLATSNHSVTDVGLLLGYATLSSFSRWFAIEFGKSPAAWRNAERGTALLERDYRAQPLQYASGSPAWA